MDGQFGQVLGQPHGVVPDGPPQLAGRPATATATGPATGPATGLVGAGGVRRWSVGRLRRFPSRVLHPARLLGQNRGKHPSGTVRNRPGPPGPRIHTPVRKWRQTFASAKDPFD
ncbi:hypothetical protein Kpho01_62610 [Kitasatospora phosalacinea]|uniref:Uncharacterized protein n=1 Tax=Kitasatospora phosalacinea TaxID=2065 RepID=A0A9W6PL20_9ACTN|nr:hypothetical protein Kpho01_62610 [Kitasatospora phosalacinea]